MAYEIPPGYEPHPTQIPAWATDMDRFRICFAITALVAQRYDPIYCRSLYDSDDLDTSEPLTEYPWAVS